jgi:chaperonin cofactor prefoldin
MDLDGEAEIEAFQRKQDMEDEQLMQAEDGAAFLSDSDEETIRVLDIEKLKVKSASLSDKQRTLLQKVDGLRRRIKKLLDANKNQNSKKV